MRKRTCKFLTRVAAFSLALYMLATPAFAIVREVEVFGAKSINDMGDSDHRVDMDGLKDDYSDFVQTDTLREYFHKDQDNPAKVDLDQSLSWLIDHNIISRDVTVTVSNVKPNKIPEVNIEKYDVSQLKAMSITRTDLLMYAYKAVYGPINARTIAVETDNVRVDDGEYITLYDLMIKNGYNPDPNTHLPGSGLTTIPGAHGTAGGTGGGAGSKGGDGGEASGTNHETNYVDDFGNWRYQPQGDLWESIFGDTNIFISQNNFQQQIVGGNGGPGGGGGAGVGTGGTGGGGSVTNGSQDQDVNTSTGDNTENTFDSHDTLEGGNAGNSGNASGTGTAGAGSTNTGGGGGGGGAASTGDNFIDYDTDYKQIYFIPGADMLFYENNEVPEVYIQAALSRGVLGFESGLRTTKEDDPKDSFEARFVEWPKNNPNKHQSWEKNSPAYVVNRSVNILRTVANVDQVQTKDVLGKYWEVKWENSTLTITRKSPFACKSGYFKEESVTKMDAYRYIYYFVYDAEKSLSDLERDIVNYKYGMELDGITNENDTDILKYLIAKGILCYDNTSELVELSAPMSWSDFLTILRRVADKDSRFNFSQIQLTDSEAQWKAKGYAPQTQHLVAGEDNATLAVMTQEEYYESNFNMGDPAEVFSGGGASPTAFMSVASQTSADGTVFVGFGAGNDTELIVVKGTYGLLRYYRITTNFEGALYNTVSDNGDHLNVMGEVSEAVKAFEIAKPPTTNLAKYTLVLLYRMRKNTLAQLQAAYPTGTLPEDPRHQLATNVLCNIWAIADMNANPTERNEVKSMLIAASNYKDKEDGKTALGDRAVAYTDAVATLLALYETLCYGGEFAPQYIKFKFSNGASTDVVSNWAGSTVINGDINNVINRIGGLQFTIKQTADSADYDSTMPATPSGGSGNVTLTFINQMIGSGSVRGSLSQTNNDFVKDVGNNIAVCVSASLKDLLKANWDEAMKQDAVDSFSNSITSFAALNSVNETSDILTYIDSDTDEAFISWSTLERYKQRCEAYGNHFPITKVSDYVLYNEDSQTYAYFSTKGSDDRKYALVGADVVTAMSDNGVVYRDGSEVYYLIDAVRLLLDAKQEAEVLGGLRTMPLADTVIQDNIAPIKLDDNTGVNGVSLTGITVLLSDDDEKTQEQTPKIPSTSVYYTKTDVYNNLRWGDFIAISTANRAINATSRRFVYTTSTGEKRTAFAVVIFEPLSESQMETVTVTPDSSLQDLLDAPQRTPQTPEGQAQFETNMNLCNAFANWIYQTKGRQYITTGYMRPHAYIYSDSKELTGLMSEADWGSLSAEQRALVEVVELKNIAYGAVVKTGTPLNKWDKDNVRSDPGHMASYMLSTDYKVCILGDRLYLNLGCFQNISTYRKNNQTVLRTNGLVLGSAAFTVGSTFMVKNYNDYSIMVDDGQKVPKITVMSTESDGTVTCQVGPIKGFPLVFNGITPVVIRGYALKKNAGGSVGDYDWESAENDLLRSIYQKMFTGSYVDISYEGLCSTPYLDTSYSRELVFDGTRIWKMGGEGNTKVVETLDYAKQGAAYMKTGSAFGNLGDKLNEIGDFRNKHIKVSTSVESYFTIKFNAFYYTLKNGVLEYSPNQASDFIAPSLFTSLNDLIINEMMDADNGAIPIEELPIGSILKIGTGHYAVAGTCAEDMSFIGYAPLNVSDLVINRATVQNVAPSYASQFIHVGSQSLNVSHFFNTIEVMQSFGDSLHQDALNIVRDGVFSGNDHPKVAIFGAEGVMNTVSHGTIMEGVSSEYTIYYAPVELTFQPGILKAYLITPPETSPAIYALVSHATDSVSGPFSSLPFFSDNILSSGVMDRTTKMSSGGFIRFYGASSLMENIRLDFQKGFAGDLFTLTRMLVFIVLIWLVVASWMCYATYFGGLMPILDAIRYPTGSRQGKGIDLMKIVSLGSITMETDFKLGRFIQYNVVLAALICVVYISGIYL